MNLIKKYVLESLFDNNQITKKELHLGYSLVKIQILNNITNEYS